MSKIDLLVGLDKERALNGLYLKEINKKQGFDEEYLDLCETFYFSEKEIKGLGLSDELKGLHSTLEKIKYVESNIQSFKGNHVKIIYSKLSDFRLILALFADKVNKITNSPNTKNLVKLIEEVYIPLSHIIGINYYVAQFEDFAIRTKHPDEYRELLRSAKKQLIRDNKEVDEIISELEKFRKYHDEEFYGRIKSPYSVFKKVHIKKTPIEEIHDFVAIRIITRSIEDCYSWLGYVFSKWEPVSGRIKDYIDSPKPNGYKSLHTTILTKNGSVEVQIRTEKMHEWAEYGIAAHWRYKGVNDFNVLDKIQRNVARITSEQTSNLKIGKEKIFTITPKGDIIILDKGSTIIDFAYAVHTEIGNHLVRATVNGEPAPLEQKLEDHDQVIVFTDKNKKPTRKWLEHAITKKATEKIRQVFGIVLSDKAKRSPKENQDLLNRTSIANCCNPFSKDEIVLFKTSKRKYVIHTLDCLLKNGKEYKDAPEYLRDKLTLKKIIIKSRKDEIEDAVKYIGIRVHYESILISGNEITLTLKILSREDADEIISKLLTINSVISAKII